MVGTALGLNKFGTVPGLNKLGTVPGLNKLGTVPGLEKLFKRNCDKQFFVSFQWLDMVNRMYVV